MQCALSPLVSCIMSSKGVFWSLFCVWSVSRSLSPSLQLHDFLCVTISLCLCLCLSRFVFMSVSLSLCIHACLSFLQEGGSVYISLSLSPLFLCMCISVFCLCLFASISSVPLSVFLSLFLCFPDSDFCLSFCLSVRPSFYLSPSHSV